MEELKLAFNPLARGGPRRTGTRTGTRGEHAAAEFLGWQWTEEPGFPERGSLGLRGWRLLQPSWGIRMRR